LMRDIESAFLNSFAARLPNRPFLVNRKLSPERGQAPHTGDFIRRSSPLEVGLDAFTEMCARSPLATGVAPKKPDRVRSFPNELNPAVRQSAFGHLRC
jgi:hypothetical protein